MGTLFNLTLYAPSQTLADEAAAAAFKRIDDLNSALSDYLPDSAITQLSKSSGSNQAVPLHPDLFAVLKRAAHYSQISDGAFDVTVGPYTRLWRRARAQHKLPTQVRLDEARAAVGHHLIELDNVNGAAKLTAPNMRLDLGAIAKGYAADEALATLAKHNLTIALIDAGGDVTLGDSPPDREGWRVAIEPLLDENYQPYAESALPPYLSVANVSVATSGDAFQHVVIDGVRYSHIVNPKTGIGLTTPIGVSVIAPTGVDADALASTLSVLGPTAGLKLIEQIPNAEALMIILDKNDEPQVYKSSNFQH